MTEQRKPAAGKRRGQRATGARRPSTIRRDARALNLYALGLSYDEIAEREGYANRSGAWKAVQRAIAEQRAIDAETVRAREIALIEQIRKPQTIAAMRGDVKAYEATLKGHDRIARLYSLNQNADHDAVQEAANLLDGIAQQLRALPDTYGMEDIA